MKKLIKKLEPSTVKTSLKKQWKKIRVIEPKPVTTEDPAATKEPATTEAEMPE